MERKYPRKLREEDLEYVDIIHLAKDKVNWDFMQMAVNFQVSQKQGISWSAEQPSVFKKEPCTVEYACTARKTTERISNRPWEAICETPKWIAEL